jgi:hypothetical protein
VATKFTDLDNLNRIYTSMCVCGMILFAIWCKVDGDTSEIKADNSSSSQESSTSEQPRRCSDVIGYLNLEGNSYGIIRCD